MTPHDALAAPASSLQARLPAHEVAATIVRVLALVAALWAAILLCVQGVAYSSKDARWSESERWMLSPILVTYAVRLVLGLVVFAKAPRIVTLAGLRPVSPAAPWTPEAAVRLGTALVGLWVLFLACWSASDVIRGLTGFAAPPSDDPYGSYLRPDVRLAVVAMAVNVGFGLLLIIGPARILRPRKASPPPPPG